jgi:nucleoporin NUP1
MYPILQILRLGFSLSTARPTNAAERALQELDVYKTPLLPTRLQHANVSGVPEMFRERGRLRVPVPAARGSAEEKELAQLGLGLGVWHPGAGKKGRKTKGKTTGAESDEEDGAEEVNNTTKPYAGEGGMRKLLARRRREEGGAGEKEKEKGEKDGEDERMEEESLEPSKATLKPTVIDLPPAQPPKPEPKPRPELSPFANIAAGSVAPTGRVGRTKTSRQHLSRPARPERSAPGGGRFSAAYEEEDSMDADAEDERRREAREIEEAARKAPAFTIPAGFSFAKPEVRLFL